MVPPGVCTVIWPLWPLTWMAREIRQTANPAAPMPRMPSPTTMATMIRTIFSALPPVLAAGVAVRTGPAKGTPAAGAPQAAQAWLPGDKAAPQFAQKLAKMASFLFSSSRGFRVKNRAEADAVGSFRKENRLNASPPRQQLTRSRVRRTRERITDSIPHRIYCTSATLPSWKTTFMPL